MSQKKGNWEGQNPKIFFPFFCCVSDCFRQYNPGISSFQHILPYSDSFHWQLLGTERREVLLAKLMGHYYLSGFVLFIYFYLNPASSPRVVLFFFINVSPCSGYRYIFSSKSMEASLDCMQTLGFVSVKKEVGKGIRERENCFKVIVKSAVLVVKKYVKL